MSLILRQSTAKAVSFGPFLDKTDGVSLEIGLVSALDHASTGIFLSKNGGALTIRHASVTATTYDAYGNYIVTLDTTDTNTVGTLRMQFSEAATCLPVWQDFVVVEEAVFDALFAASAPGYGIAQTGDTYALANGASGFVAIKTETASIQTDTNTLETEVAKIPKSDGTATWNATALAAIQTQAEDALVVHRLDELLNADSDIDGAAPPTVGSVFHELLTKTAGSFTYDQTTDSLEALRDNTGTAGAGLTAIDLPDQTMNITGNITGNLSGSVGSVTGAVGSVTGAVGSVTGLTNATIADAVWDEDATAHQTQGTFGQAIGDPAADANTIYGAVVTGAAGATVAADIIAVKTDTAATLVDTNELQTDWTNGGRLDLILDIIAADTTTDIPASIAALNDLNATEVEDAVWDAVMANHLDAGSTGAALNAAGAAGDPWITPIPGAYIAGQAGYVVGTTLVGELAKVPKSDGVLTFNATCSSDIKSGLSTQAELNKVPKSDSNVTWNATALASIQTEANDAIVANRLDELLAADSDIDGAAPPTVGSVFHELMTKTAGSFTYDQTTDSLEAIKDRGDAAWTTATGFSTFDPTTDPVLLADGAHGGSSTTITAKSISVVNNTNNGVAVNIQGTGTGNSHGINLSSTNGKALAIGAVGNAVSIDSSAANGLVVTGATGDIVADITGALSSVGNIADAVWDEAIADHLGAGSTGAALNGASAPTAAAVADAVWEEAIADHSGTVGSTAAKLAASSSQTSVDDLPTNGELATALGTADDAVLTAIADLPTAIENADALLNRDMSTGTDSGSATVRTPRQALRFLRNKWAPDGLGNIKIYKEDDVTESWKFVPTATPGASPITETDPEGP